MSSAKSLMHSVRHVQLRPKKIAVIVTLALLSLLPFIYYPASRYQNSLPSYNLGIFGSLLPSTIRGTHNKRPYNPKSQDGYSIKPLAYVFPQFHPIPENDKFWGVNFTEWTNVKKITKNRFGLETLQPTEEVGYYNLLDKSTRQRYTKLARDSGLYGFVYHHYWFGRPVMEKPLQAILRDGEPNVPFMLSWANEPWNAHWNGIKDEHTLIDQVYGGIDGWRKHFDWLLPYFKHPLYIRSNGKVQFVVYSPSHLSDTGQGMYAAWRKWAVEEGLGGLNIIETVIHGDDPNSRGPSDAMNEFGPRTHGEHDATTWVNVNRLSRVYHRGVRVTWDPSPRHIVDGDITADVFIHPDLWKISVTEVMQRMKLEPNPPGDDNFLFINALNEWGEGNVLEPSIQWGDKFSVALREAVEATEELPWKHELLIQHEKIQKEVETEELGTDICVVIRVLDPVMTWETPFDLAHLLRSLQAQSNRKWRAIVARVNPGVNPRMASAPVAQAMDSRITLVELPNEIVDKYHTDPDARLATDWMVKHLTDFHPSCNNAPYFLVANSSNTYEPSTFDLAVRGAGDIVGLNFMSPATMALVDRNMTWDERCDRFADEEENLCLTMEPKGKILDVGAALISLPKWQLEGHQFSKQMDNRAYLKFLSEHGWIWSVSEGADCHLIHGKTLPACARSGRIWVDAPANTYEGKFKPGCTSLQYITPYFGWDTKQWDMERFKEDPFCLRFTESAYQYYLDKLKPPEKEKKKGGE